MDVVKSNIEGLKGRVNITSTPGEGCVFTLDLPQTLATTRIILIRIDTQFFGVPVEFVHSNGWVNIDELYTLEGTTSITLEGQPTSVARAAHILEMTNVKNYRQGEVIASIVIRDGNEKLLLLVDEVIDEQELVIKPTGTLLRRVRNISGAGILGTGEVCMVLNPPDMLRDARRCILAKQDTSATHMMAERPWIETEREENRRAVVLLAEDSAITRAQERRILQGAGYEVIMAVDGREAWEKLQQHEVDAVVSDIMMPGMNGFELTQSIRASHQYDDLPVILVTTLSSNEDKRKGMESGADAYITKASFEQKKLLDTLARLLGYE